MPTIKQVPKIGILPLRVHSERYIQLKQVEVDCPFNLQFVLPPVQDKAYEDRIKFLACVHRLDIYICQPAIYTCLYTNDYQHYLLNNRRFNYSKRAILSLVYRYCCYSRVSLHEIRFMNKNTLLSRISRFSLSSC